MNFLKLCTALAALGAIAAMPLGAAGNVQTTLKDVRREIQEIQAQAQEAAFVPNEIVVRMAGEAEARVVKLAPGASAQDLLARWRSRENVLYAEPNYIATAFEVPNDPLYSYQWHLEQIGMEQAWDGSDGSGVIVAVLDTGIARLSDLANTSFVPGYDFVNNDADATDDNGHGTHVAGTIAQATNNSLGVAGVARGASLMPLKVLDSRGSGTYADVAKAIRYAADHGAQVLNMSLGGPVGASYLQEALQYAHGKGVSIVAAAGNDGKGMVSYPAAYDSYVIAVGATRFDKQKTSYSNYGFSLDVMAPGGDTSIDQNGDGYGDGVLQQTFRGTPGNAGYYFYQGTSMASPHVAGVAALLISHGTATTPEQVRFAIESTAEDLGTSGPDFYYGHGLLRAAAALQSGSDNAPVAPSPEPAPAPPPLEVFGESFEQGLGNWTQDSQSDWFVSSQRAKEGRYAAQVDGRASDAELTSPLIDLQGKEQGVISFSWYIERYLDWGEYLAFDVSFDNGLTWEEYARLRGNQDAEETWNEESFAISNADTVRLRFRGAMSLSSEDANVDDIAVKVW